MMQDFVGFTYNGKHSIRDLKIYRTSNSNRYTENLTATMTDKTVDVPGGNGQYYFGTTFKNRTFTINYAFDNLNESDLRVIKETFRGDEIHDLVFDETPYKAWSAKVTGTASMKYLCFGEEGERRYKGEGSITFTCYYPFAHTPRQLWTVSGGTWTYVNKDGKYLNNYDNNAYPNKEEWQDASRLGTGGNPGDLPTPFVLTTKSEVSSGTVLRVGGASIQITQNTTGPVTWDSRTGLVYCTSGVAKTLVPYTGNSIATIPVGTVGSLTTAPVGASLTYDYLYL